VRLLWFRERTALVARVRELEAENERLRWENAALQARVRELETRLEVLERRLNQNSSNSSKPPSSDPPSVKLPPKKKPTGRRPGGQPGHKAAFRPLVPVEQVDEVVHHWPDDCEGCGDKLARRNRTEVGDPERHQVTEIPEVKGHVTEHQLHSQMCACGHTTCAELPPGVPSGAFGPRLVAVVALFTGLYRVSRRVAVSALGDLFGVKLALGSISNAEEAMSTAVSAPVEQARQHVERQPVAYVDETGWRQGRMKAWLWTAAAGTVAVFMVHAKRSTAAAKELLGNFAGILITDRWSAYAAWALSRRQLCWAHLLRDFNFIAESKGTAGQIGGALVRLHKKVFRHWHRVRDGTITRDAFKKNVAPIRQQIELLLKSGVVCHAPKVAGMCNELLEAYPALWTFVDVEGVEPTNNFAERNLRPAVLWRKVSFGSHSEAGSRFAARMMTVGATLKLQGRNVLDYLVQANEAALFGRPAPSLLSA
jgi:transposase